MANLSCSRASRKCSSFATKHFQRKLLKIFDLHPPLICGANKHVKSEMLSNRHTDTHTHRPSTVTLTVHVRRGLISNWDNK